MRTGMMEDYSVLGHLAMYMINGPLVMVTYTYWVTGYLSN